MQTFEQEFHRMVAKFDAENGKENSKPLPEEEPEEFDVYIEEDRITVVKRPEPQPQAQVIETVTPSQTQSQPYVAHIAMTVSLLLICYLVTSAFINTFFPPVVTVTLLMKSQTITTLATIQLPVRTIPPITLSQQRAAPATGMRHQDATYAHGFITFYNGQFTTQLIPAGMILTGADEVTVATDQDALIPAAKPPVFGQVTVSAHVVETGNIGNISAYDINKPCCLASVLAVNHAPFTGGMDERDYTVVTQADVENTASTLMTALHQQMIGSLEARVQQTETLIRFPCSQTVTPNPHVGEEASQVHITVSETCNGIAYTTQALKKKATTILSAQAEQKLGANYHLLGNVQVSVVKTNVLNTSIILTVRSQGTWVYLIRPAEEQHIKRLLTGKQKKDVLRFLLSLPGIQQAVISGIDNLQKLPKDPNAIHILLILPENP